MIKAKLASINIKIIQCNKKFVIIQTVKFVKVFHDHANYIDGIVDILDIKRTAWL